MSRLVIIFLLATAAAAQNSARSPADGLVRQGVAAMQKGDSAQAEVLFHRALQANPGSFEAHTYLGVLADQAGRLQDAEQQFAAAVASSPQSPEARNNYGAILVKMGRSRQAATEFETSLRLNPRQPAALVNLAQIRIAQGTSTSLRSAQELLGRAQAIAPDPQVARALVLVALRLNDRDAAVRDYAAYTKQLEDAPASVQSASASLELGEALLQAGLLDDAATELNAAVAAEPENARAVVALARAYELRKDVAAAGRTLELAVSHGVHAAPVYAELAEVYEASGHVANAIPTMRLAIDADPKNEAYRFRYGMMLCDTKAPAAAAIRLKEALQEFPSSPRLWFALGIAYFSDNKTEDAAGAFSKAVQLDDKFAPAYAYLGMSQVDSGRYSEAVKLYDKALALRESFPAAHYLRAEALLKLEPPDEVSAERDLARAVALQPSLMQAHLELGKIYLHTGRTQQGVAELEGVVKDAPDIAEAHYQLGRAYQKLARRDDAQAQFSSFERLQKEQREQTIAERQRLLKQLADVRF